MEEYRKWIKMRPVYLTDTDFQELEGIVSKDLRPDESLKPSYKAEHGTRIIESDTITGFFTELGQDVVPSAIDISYWIRRQGDPLSRPKYVSVGLRRDIGALGSSLWITSPDQTWFLGETQLLTEFFRKRHLWYWRIAPGLPWGLCTIIGIQLSLFLSFLRDRNVVAASYSALSLLISVVVYVLAAKSILFPGFVLSGPVSSKPSALRTSTFWTAAGAIGTLVNAILGLVQLVMRFVR